MSRRSSAGTMSRATPAWRWWATWTRTGRSRWPSATSADSRRIPALRPWVPQRLPSKITRDRAPRSRRARPALPRSGRRVPHFHADDAPLLLLGDMLARGRASRLYRKLVIEEQIAQDVTAYQSGRELAGSFGIVVTLRPSRSISQALGPGRIRARRHCDRRGDGRGAAPRAECEGRQLLLRPGAHRRIRRRRRSSQRLQRLPRRSVADHDRCPRFRSVTPHRTLASLQVAISTDRPRVSLSVLGRKKTGDRDARSTAGPARQPGASRFRPPMPEILTLSSGMPLWVFPRHDLPTVAGSIVIPGGGGLQRPERGRAGPVDGRHARRRDHDPHGRTDRDGRRVHGRHDRRNLRLGRHLTWRSAASRNDLGSHPGPGGRHPAEPDLPGGGMASASTVRRSPPSGRSGTVPSRVLTGPSVRPLPGRSSLPLPAGGE